MRVLSSASHAEATAVVQHRGVSRWRLLLLPLVVVLPLLAYGVGSLVGTPESPADPQRIVLDQSDDDGGGRARGRDPATERQGRDDHTAPDSSPTSTPSADPSAPVERQGEQDDVVVVTPEPTTVRDDDGDEGPTVVDGDEDDDATDGRTDDDSEDRDD